MFHREKIVVRLLCGAALAASILVAPGAFAQSYDHHNYSNGHASTDSHRARHDHRHHLGTNASSRHYAAVRHHGRYMSAAYHHEGVWRETVYGESRYHRARTMRASYEPAANHAAIEAKREELDAADERERPITAEFNLVQLRKGRERAAEIAQWQLRYAAASTKG